jgi:hypothetical protein
MNAVVVTFDSSGAGSCVYSELIDLHAIGSLEIRRASHIEFNNASQKWEVKNLRGNVLFFAKTRTACVECEQQSLAAVHPAPF